MLTNENRQALLDQGKAFAGKISACLEVAVGAPAPLSRTLHQLSDQYDGAAAVLTDGAGHRALVLLDRDASATLGADPTGLSEAIAEAAACLCPAGNPMAVEAAPANDWAQRLGSMDKPAYALAIPITAGGQGSFVLAFPQAEEAKEASLPELKPGNGGVQTSSLRHIEDIPLEITVEVGRTTMTVREMLRIVKGSIIPLNKMAEDPVDILVNGKLFARGEIVVIDEAFGVRVTEIIHQGITDR